MDTGEKAMGMNRKTRARLPRIQSLRAWFLIYTKKNLARRVKKVKENLARIREKRNQRTLPTMLVPRVMTKNRTKHLILQKMRNRWIPPTRQIAAGSTLR